MMATKSSQAERPAKKPCILRQKSAPSRYGSRRYLPQQTSTASASSEYLTDTLALVGQPIQSEISFTSDSSIWTISPSRPRLKLDLTAKQPKHPSATSQLHTLLVILVLGVLVITIVGFIMLLMTAGNIEKE